MLKLLVVVASLFIGGGMAMGEPGGADGFSAVAAVDPGANPEAQLDEEPQEVSEAPAYRVDDLTFLYLTHEVYLEPYVSCRPKVLGERSYVACWNETYSGRSPLNFWEYDGVTSSPSTTRHVCWPRESSPASSASAKRPCRCPWISIWTSWSGPTR